MPSNYGISISVVCGGAVLDEYAWQAVDDRTVSCFVASASGKVIDGACSGSRKAAIRRLAGT